MIIPNGLGVVFSIFQIESWLYFYNKGKSTPSLEPFMDNEKQTQQ
jgi:hypothetical protein